MVVMLLNSQLWGFTSDLFYSMGNINSCTFIDHLCFYVKWMCHPSVEDKCLTLEAAGQQQKVRPELPADMVEVPIVLSCPLTYILSEFPKSEPPL